MFTIRYLVETQFLSYQSFATWCKTHEIRQINQHPLVQHTVMVLTTQWMLMLILQIQQQQSLMQSLMQQKIHHHHHHLQQMIMYRYTILQHVPCAIDQQDHPEWAIVPRVSRHACNIVHQAIHLLVASSNIDQVPCSGVLLLHNGHGPQGIR